MKEINFKPLAPSQIEVRPTDTKFKGSCSLLLYIDSRCAANILNEAVGEFNWQIEYKPVNDKVYGRLSIWDEDRQMWVYKEDTGAESNIEAEKGQASDILKRCIARWGCDYLYSSPRIKIKCPDDYYYNEHMTMTFYVKHIAYSGKNISELAIADRHNNIVFNWKANDPYCNFKGDTEASNSTDNKTLIKDFCTAQKGKEGVNMNELKNFFNFYTKKADTWKGTMNVPVLYEKWGQTRS